MVAPYSGAMLAMVARSASESDAAPSPKYSTNFPTTLAFRRHPGGGGTTPGARPPSAPGPAEVDADDARRKKVPRLPQHPRLGLDPADAPADDAESVDHRRVRVGADERVGVPDAVLL